jgi:DNA-binding transcriptional ArsR family regulator
MLTNQQLVTAMKHPTRAHAVTVLNERVACAAEIGREIGKSSGHVSYHLLQLEKYGVIELVKEVDGKGGATTSKFYRALARSWYDPESWKQVESKHQPGITAGILASCNSDLSTAVQFGTIHFPDNHLGRTPLLVDPVGYRELVERLDTLLPELIEMQQRAAGRMTRGDVTVLAKAHIIQFPSPDAGRRAIPIVVAPPSDAKPPELSEDEVLLALEHPTRVHALMVLNERITSAAEIGREIGGESHNVSYHLKMLRRLGLIELVEVAETPGGRLRGKFYRALIRPWFDFEGWMKVNPKRQAAITSTILGLCNTDIGEAVRAGTINDPDSHISRTPMVLDRKTYRELVLLLDQAISDVLVIQEQSKQRLLEGADRVATKLHLFFFESPDPESD